jgi:hypothetical protein
MARRCFPMDKPDYERITGTGETIPSQGPRHDGVVGGGDVGEQASRAMTPEDLRERGVSRRQRCSSS